MSQRWWIGIAGVVGIIAAVLFIPRPDTGGAITAAPVDLPTEGQAKAPPPPDDPISARPAKPRASGQPEAPASARVPGVNGMKRPGGVALDRGGVAITEGANPLAAAAASRRNSPEAIAAGRISAPWTQISRQLTQAGEEELAAEANDIVSTLREMRRSPQDFDFVELEAQMSDLEARISTAGANSDETDRMFELIDDRMTDYRAAVEAE